MIINKLLKKEQPQEILRYTPIKALEIKTGLILEKALLSKESPSLNTLKDLRILSGISKALRLFLEEFAKRFEKEKPSLFAIYAQTFREFDLKKGCVVAYKLLSVDKTN